MKGRNELAAPCGLYCGVCGIFVAHRDKDQKLKEKLATVYGLRPEDIKCKGCLSESDDVFFYCQVCAIKNCTKEKEFEGCYQCDDFPCKIINEFPVPVGKKVMLRSVPAWRELGTEKWMDGEENRYTCPHCGIKLFRGAKRCRNCKETVDMD
jgi:predicted RNA-binding Zn-ribbon protein involved in translation (DUF1610 family)